MAYDNGGNNMKLRKMNGRFIGLVLLALCMFVVTACSTGNGNGNNAAAGADKGTATETNAGTNAATPAEEEAPTKGTLALANENGYIGDKVTGEVTGLDAGTEVELVWVAYSGEYELGADNYTFFGTKFTSEDQVITKGTVDESGAWQIDFVVPEGFGGDHDVKIMQGDTKLAQANFFVETRFTMSPMSGPIGTEITVIGEGIATTPFGSLWHLNYDNKQTGMITSRTTDGRAVAKFRAAGEEGIHGIWIESGSSGFPYLARAESPVNMVETQYFQFEVTSDEPVVDLAYSEPIPEAGTPVVMAEVQNKDGVTVDIDKERGYVDDPVSITASGLPADTDVNFIWHSMKGSRVSQEGFAPMEVDMATVKTDASGNLQYDFTIPEELGGIPHLIDLSIGGEVYGQTYLRILPQIISVTPQSGPPGTVFKVLVKGMGWTEYDNAYFPTYDNGHVGFVCGFNTQGTLEIPMVAAGNEGYHLVDIFPGIYRGREAKPDLFLRPQLTYAEDHPGTGIPALHTYFEVTAPEK
jgi:hypothetical protein